MALPDVSMRELIEAGVHFGHKTRRWNPHMAPFIYGVRNDTHIIDLGQTVPMLQRALHALRETAARGGRILFVGTKRQASEIIADTAKASGQFYINERWLGGLLTNWNTIQASIKRLKTLEAQLAGDESTSMLTKKELLNLDRSRLKLERSLGGIKDMGRQPDLLFIIDTNREELAIKEGIKLGIPIVAIVDTNASVEGITYPIPGNDDATRAIRLYCELAAKAILDGAQDHQARQPQEVKFREPKAEAKPAEAAAPAEDKVKSTTKKAARAEIAKKASGKQTEGKAKEPKAAAEKAEKQKSAAKIEGEAKSDAPDDGGDVKQAS